MAMEFVCPACQGMLSVADDAVGRVVRCGNCLTALRVPEPASSGKSAPETPPAPRSSRVVPVEPPGMSGDRDEHGEPRTRRRGAKKAAGRSPLFWLLIIVMSLSLFTCLACGGLTLVLATPHWHNHHSREGGFKVDLPAPSNSDIAQQAKLKLKPNEFVEGTMLVGRLEFYWVWYTDIDPKGPRPADDAILKLLIEQMKKDTPGTIVRQTPSKVDGFPASEIVITNPQGDTHHCLIVVAKTRVYIASAGGPFVSPEGNKRIRKFFDSLHIVKDENPWRGKAAPKNDD